MRAAPCLGKDCALNVVWIDSQSHLFSVFGEETTAGVIDEGAGLNISESFDFSSSVLLVVFLVSTQRAKTRSSRAAGFLAPPAVGY